MVYEVLKTNGEVIQIDNPDALPAMNYVKEIREPIVEATILLPPDFVEVFNYVNPGEEFKNAYNI
ncbi:MAG: hypothetical protein Ct9H300mP6_05490 [Gammaproteobacteria bacterium]|nr:MAG: hypothetical protein Ct9H300mP6_05490 [Gammaproteobacteria bacterium]